MDCHLLLMSPVKKTLPMNFAMASENSSIDRYLIFSKSRFYRENPKDVINKSWHVPQFHLASRLMTVSDSQACVAARAAASQEGMPSAFSRPAWPHSATRWDFRLAVSENLALYGPMRRELAGGEKYASVVFISLPKALSYFSRQEAEQKFNRKSKKNIWTRFMFHPTRPRKI